MLTENVHWSHRLDSDAITLALGDRPGTLGDRPATLGDRPATLGDRPATLGDRPATFRQRSTEGDFYGTEDADSAFLRREPVSFAVFGKPGLPDDQLATALATRWGCVHVSVAHGVAAGRADARTAWALRRGRAVRVASTPGALVELLGLREPEVKERGYVLSGLPRYQQCCQTSYSITRSNFFKWSSS